MASTGQLLEPAEDNDLRKAFRNQSHRNNGDGSAYRTKARTKIRVIGGGQRKNMMYKHSNTSTYEYDQKEKQKKRPPVTGQYLTRVNLTKKDFSIRYKTTKNKRNE